MNRHTRALIIFRFVWGWWNVVIGPGMFGYKSQLAIASDPR